MAQHARPTQPRPSPSTTRPRPLSADFLSSYPDLNLSAQGDKQSSMLYSMLPSAVQNRLPRIPSLRRSVSLYGIAGRRKSSSATGSSSSTRPVTPEEAAAYGAVVLRERTEEVGLFEGREDPFRQRGIGDVLEEKSGIGWKHAGQGESRALFLSWYRLRFRRLTVCIGLNLLSLALNEASSISPSDQASDRSSSFARQLYIHALTYLLNGLPQDLTAEETLSVRSALPQSLAQPIHITGSSTTTDRATIRRPAQPPSLLHRTLASTIVQFFVLLSLLLPYIKLFLRKAHEYERTHHVTETLLRSGLGAFDELGKRGVGVSAAVWGAGVGDLCGWVLEEIGAGVRDGVEGGLVRVKGDAPKPSPVAGL